ncbi:MAG: hypothetical protein AAF197_01815 [Pseudomonadota bacterium]
MEEEIIAQDYNIDKVKPVAHISQVVMASACVPICIIQEGPKARIEHGISGFLANDNIDFFHLATLVAADTEQRPQMALATRN